MLEIELKENFRRRQEELQNKIERLGAAEAGDASASEELEARVRELKSLDKTIENLQKKIQGEKPLALILRNFDTCSSVRARERDREGPIAATGG